MIAQTGLVRLNWFDCVLARLDWSKWTDLSVNWSDWTGQTGVVCKLRTGQTELVRRHWSDCGLVKLWIGETLNWPDLNGQTHPPRLKEMFEKC